MPTEDFAILRDTFQLHTLAVEDSETLLAILLGFRKRRGWS
jgi:hypothetical protein